MSSKRIRLANRLLTAAWAGGLARRPSLDPGELAAIAARRGDGDFGPTDIWWPNLALLTASLEDEARLSPLGRVIAHGQIVAALRNRGRAYALWRRHPEIRRRALPRPIVILGQMRSGTTRLQRMLASDRAFAVTRFFEGFTPLPATRSIWADDRPARAAIGLAAARLLNPRFSAIHPTGVFAPDEEIGLQSFSLFGSAFEAQWRIPHFARTLERADTRPFYREFADLVRTLSWLRGDPEHRTVVLKLPQFGQDVAALLETFPDARIIRLEREPAEIIASSASLVENQMRLQSDAVDPLWIGREWTRKYALREARMDAALNRPGVQSLAIPYDLMSEDWRGTMRCIYDFLGLPLSHEAEREMSATVARDRQGRFRKHRYDPERYGLPVTA